MKLTEIADDEPTIVPILNSILKKGHTVLANFHLTKDDPYDRFDGQLVSINKTSSGRFYALCAIHKGDVDGDAPNTLLMGSSMIERLELNPSDTEPNTWILTYEAE